MSENGTFFEDKMRRFKGECAYFSFKKCPIYTHDGEVPNLSLTHTKRIIVHPIGGVPLRTNLYLNVPINPLKTTVKK